MTSLRSSASAIFRYAAIAFVLVAVRAHAESPGSIQIVELGGGYEFLEDGKPVMFYQRAPKSLDGKFTRANYVHPLYDLDGRVISEDFPEDHRHHRGVFWAWHQVYIGDEPVGDSWTCSDFVWDVTDVKTKALDNGSAALIATVLWKSPKFTDDAGVMKPFVKETAVIRAHRRAGDTRAIDFEIRIEALVDGFRLGGSDDDKGYGGFSPRIRLPADVKFTGRVGPVTPQRNEIAAGPWLDLSATFDNAGDAGAISGVAMLAHPSLPVFPPTWILRDKRSMQNAVYPGRTPVSIPRDQPVTLRYRLLIHRGDVHSARIDHHQRQYEREALPTLLDNRAGQ